MNYEDMIGKRFGEWTVIDIGEPRILPKGNKQKTLKCRCDCGTIRDVAIQRLKNGGSKSCGDCKKPNLIGRKFEYFTVVGIGEKYKRNNGQMVRTWDCVCVCGNHRYLTTQEVTTQKRKSCGCKQKEFRVQCATIHGDSHKRLHNTWSKMRSRCYTKSDYHYKWYGARGIKMCDEWKDNYLSFKEWARRKEWNDGGTR